MSEQFRVLITDHAWPDVEVERQILVAVGAEVVEAPGSDEETLVRSAADVDAIGTNWARVTDRVIDSASGCRVVARFGIGLDNIDVAAATDRGIPVTNVPDYCVDEVSDHALALLLACARKVAFYHARTKSGEYDLQSGPSMRRLSQQTAGIVGLGHIGRALLPKLQVLGLNVVAHTSSGSDHGTGCRMVDLNELLQVSDFVTLHLPLTDRSRHLLGRSEFQKMKPSAYLINTSRGGLIDHAALHEALENEELAGAALDVFDPEPPDLTSPLFRDERVIATPHAAFVSQESVSELRRRAAQQIADALSGKRPENVVNPQVYG